MAILHRADLRPTKLELLGGWLPAQSWYVGDEHSQLVAVGAYRFDDPLGEVGIETHLIRAEGGPILQVPLTYRGVPLPGGERFLIGTTQHSVLGRRWVYDACADPVYASVLTDVVLGYATQAEEYVEGDGRRDRRTPTVFVTGTGTGPTDRGAPAVRQREDVDCSSDGNRTVITSRTHELTLLRVVDPAARTTHEHALHGTWSGLEQPVPLATARGL
ncbi:CG0192-related protein [Nocardioides sp. Soil805]|uniref:CG0192-related protein n=1 Tax=Nocardioides sp. Soil805 TaxID=1736416 RepID=UPI0007024FC6|nr:hypothetical protein [Nocardioides sp. Soil805]KRF37112.1 hypothetical protein ASG94_07015 [Nocardioides sp. Soil805]